MKFGDIINQNIVKTAGLFVAMVAISAVSGGVAGNYAARSLSPVSEAPDGFKIPGATSTQAQKNPLDSEEATATIRLIPVQMQNYAERVVPESIFNRQSPVALVYVRKSAETFFVEESMLGRAVAVTSDGWFVTVPGVVESHKTADLAIWYKGQSYKIEKMLLDKSLQATYIKISAKDLPSIPFADLWASKAGLATWLEPAPDEYIPSSIESLRSKIAGEPVSSEKAERRLVAQGHLRKNEMGTPLWDARGALVGIADSAADGRLTLIPGSNLSASLQSLISNGQIAHSSLGVYSMDLFLMHFVTADDSMPSRGVLLKEDKRSGRSVVKDSAAEKAGLKSNDVILQVDRDILDGSSDLSDILLQYKPNSKVTLRVWRAGKEIEITVTLGQQITSEIIP